MGSSQTGDDLVAGETNGANDPTLIVADRRSPNGEEAWGVKNGAILLVTPTRGIEDRPIVRIDGIVGVANRGGAGVRGIGNQPEGPRGEHSGSGTGGDGVIGHGGTGDLEASAAGHGGFVPGTGVLGIGGYWTGPARVDKSERDGRGGPGVVGVAGGDQTPARVPSFEQAKGVGVYGASAENEGVVAEGGPNSAGLRATGMTGVKGEGNTIGVQGNGPVGVAAYGEQQGIIAVGTNRAGIEVEGPDAILARGGKSGGVFTGGYGIRAKGYPFPGGTFESGQPEDPAPRAQVRLVPQPMWAADQAPAQLVYVVPESTVDQLPVDGNAGNLLVTIKPERPGSDVVPPRAQATLWFCTVSAFVDPVSGRTDPAIWQQVPLGQPIAGKQGALLGI